MQHHIIKSLLTLPNNTPMWRAHKYKVLLYNKLQHQDHNSFDTHWTSEKERSISDKREQKTTEMVQNEPPNRVVTQS